MTQPVCHQCWQEKCLCVKGPKPTRFSREATRIVSTVSPNYPNRSIEYVTTVLDDVYASGRREEREATIEHIKTIVAGYVAQIDPKRVDGIVKALDALKGKG